MKKNLVGFNINICRIFFNKIYLELFLKSLVADVDRRIKRGQERLRLTQGYLPEELPKVIKHRCIFLN
jgi:hypothetical protein